MTVKLVVYIMSMAVITYLIRMLPLVLLRREIKSRFLKDFFFYIPYTVLGAMTLPAIFYSTGSFLTAAVGFVAAVLTALKKDSLLLTAGVACAAVLVTELLLQYVFAL